MSRWGVGGGGGVCGVRNAGMVGERVARGCDVSADKGGMDGWSRVLPPLLAFYKEDRQPFDSSFVRLRSRPNLQSCHLNTSASWKACLHGPSRDCTTKKVWDCRSPIVPAWQIPKLPGYQIGRFPDDQITRFADCQIASWTDCPIRRIPDRRCGGGWVGVGVGWLRLK